MKSASTLRIALQTTVVQSNGAAATAYKHCCFCFFPSHLQKKRPKGMHTRTHFFLIFTCGSFLLAISTDGEVLQCPPCALEWHR